MLWLCPAEKQPTTYECKRTIIVAVDDGEDYYGGDLRIDLESLGEQVQKNKTKNGKEKRREREEGKKCSSAIADQILNKTHSSERYSETEQER